MTLVDTNILLDVLTNDPVWRNWSILNLGVRASQGRLIINEVVYAEMAGHVPTASELDACLREIEVTFENTPKLALFIAGVAFRQYRRRGGVRTGVLPDFFIGAYAQVAGLPLLTRDTQRYRTYFPELELIAPEGY